MTKAILLVSLAAIFVANANAGIVKFSAKHIVKPVAKHSYHGAKKVVKVSKKVLF